jgi:alpha/beta superfamily hydrolase
MNKPKGLVHFCHGKESRPWGVKITRLATVARSFGFAVESLDYSGIDDPDLRVEKLLNSQPPTTNLILVGSSLGGYVATMASQTLNPSGLFLLAPAVRLPGYGDGEIFPKARHTVIVHGWRDEIIPVENSFSFARQFRTQLHLIDGDHRLNDQIAVIEIIFKNFLEFLQSSE